MTLCVALSDSAAAPQAECYQGLYPACWTRALELYAVVCNIVPVDRLLFNHVERDDASTKDSELFGE